MTGKIPLHQIQTDTRKREYPQVKLSFNTTLSILNYIYNTVHFTIGRKRKRCGECFGCKAEDCRECKFCVDKPKYGGPGKLKQVCKRRKCVQASQNLDKKQQQNGSLLSLFITNVSLNFFFQDKEVYGSVKMITFLRRHSRRLDRAQPDGNCLFRSLSKQLFSQ